MEYPGHEAVAQFLAAPLGLRQFKSITELAKYFNVTRTTVYRWKSDIDVLRRADWLSMRNRVAGDLAARRAWERIMKSQVKAAISGDTQAAKFCADHAWPENSENEVTGFTLDDGIRSLDAMWRPPSWVLEQQEKAARKKEDSEPSKMVDAAAVSGGVTDQDSGDKV